MQGSDILWISSWERLKHASFGHRECGTSGRGSRPDVVGRYAPDYEVEYAHRGWKMFPTISRVYVNKLPRRELGWSPRYDFHHVIERLKADDDFRSPLAQVVGSKGYHAEVFSDGPYPVE